MYCERNDSSDEVEITPRMIEAGVEAYALFELLDPGDWIVSAVYRAMERARSIEEEDVEGT